MLFNLFEKACLEWAKAYLLIKKDETGHHFNIRERLYYSKINHLLQQSLRDMVESPLVGFQTGIGQGAW